MGIIPQGGPIICPGPKTAYMPCFPQRKPLGIIQKRAAPQIRRCPFRTLIIHYGISSHSATKVAQSLVCQHGLEIRATPASTPISWVIIVAYPHVLAAQRVQPGERLPFVSLSALQEFTRYRRQMTISPTLQTSSSLLSGLGKTPLYSPHPGGFSARTNNSLPKDHSQRGSQSDCVFDTACQLTRQ